jgi:parvulin-like peptidyl-prolyl isomerase
MHYYETQQQVDFSSSDAKTQLTTYKQQALQEVVDDAYVKQLAAQYHVSVSNQDVNNEVTLVTAENRLGGSQQVFNDVLNQFWGWSITDFKRELKQQLLTQAVVSKLDTANWQRANQALAELKAGTPFANVASQLSDDTATKGQGGQYSNIVTESDADVSPQITTALFKLKPGQYSEIINTGYSLEIVEALSQQGDGIKAAHIEFDFQNISTYIKPLEVKEPVHDYIHV